MKVHIGLFMGPVQRPSDTALTFALKPLIKDAEDKPLPPVQVIFYKEVDGSVPMVEWIEGLQKKPRQKCFEWIERLKTSGHELHRPYADTLGDGIHELRVRFQSVNYRMLYFFHKDTAVVLTHGLTKEKEIPEKEIGKALVLKRNFENDPEAHTFQWET